MTPREIADAPFAKGQSPSLPARRTLLLMIATAAAGGWQGTFLLKKRDLRQGHESNDRISGLLDEVMSIRFQIPSLSSRGRASIVRAYLFEEIEEETDDGDTSVIEFSFSRRAIALFSGSDVYASLSRTALLAFNGRYAVTLYQLGCLLCGKRDPTIRLTVPELRQRLGVADDIYRDFAQLRRKVLEAAKAEIDHLAHFEVSITEHRSGRKIIAVTLGFWRKADTAIDAAAAELARPKVGRKARRDGTVERVADEAALPPLADVAAAGAAERAAARPKLPDMKDLTAASAAVAEAERALAQRRGRRRAAEPAAEQMDIEEAIAAAPAPPPRRGRR